MNGWMNTQCDAHNLMNKTQRNRQRYEKREKERRRSTKGERRGKHSASIVIISHRLTIVVEIYLNKMKRKIHKRSNRFIVSNKNWSTSSDELNSMPLLHLTLIWVNKQFVYFITLNNNLVVFITFANNKKIMIEFMAIG